MSKGVVRCQKMWQGVKSCDTVSHRIRVGGTSQNGVFEKRTKGHVLVPLFSRIWGQRTRTRFSMISQLGTKSRDTVFCTFKIRDKSRTRFFVLLRLGTNRWTCFLIVSGLGTSKDIMGHNRDMIYFISMRNKNNYGTIFI